MADAVNLEVGSKSPNFDTVDSKGTRHNLADLVKSGEKVILYFYPRIPHQVAPHKRVTFRRI